MVIYPFTIQPDYRPTGRENGKNWHNKNSQQLKKRVNHSDAVIMDSVKVTECSADKDWQT